MDTSSQIKIIFGDLLMQIAFLQAQLAECQQKIAELTASNNTDK